MAKQPTVMVSSDPFGANPQTASRPSVAMQIATPSHSKIAAPVGCVRIGCLRFGCLRFGCLRRDELSSRAAAITRASTANSTTARAATHGTRCTHHAREPIEGCASQWFGYATMATMTTGAMCQR